MNTSVWKKVVFICLIIGVLALSFLYGTGEDASVSEQGQIEASEVDDEVGSPVSYEVGNGDRQASSYNRVNDSGKASAVSADNNREEKKKSDSGNVFTQIVMHIKQVFPSGSKSKKGRDTQNNKVAQTNAKKATDKAVKNSKKKTTGSDSEGDSKADNIKENNNKKNNGSKKKSGNKKKDSEKDSNHSGAGETDSIIQNTEQPETTEAPDDGKTVTCTILISCSSLLNHMEKLPEEKRKLVPENGILLNATDITVKQGSSVFDVLKLVTKENQIQLEYSYTPAYKNYYVEGIGNLYAFDAGTSSGWMYSVNDEFTGYGSSACIVSEGDEIKWLYTCSFGKDAGEYIK